MLGSIIGGIGSVVGSIFGSKERSKDRKLQLRAMTHGIRDRVADAKAAGIHPLAALGAATTSYSPVGSGGIEAGMARAGEAFGKAASGSMEKRIGESQIAVNEAQAQLYKAQATTEVVNARNRAIGVAGVKNKLPDPSVIKSPSLTLKPAPGTKAQEIEDDVGGAIAEIIGIDRVIGGLDEQFKKDPRGLIKWLAGSDTEEHPSLYRRLKRWVNSKRRRSKGAKK